jgi:isopenicillin N synthase-like dioxygenase
MEALSQTCLDHVGYEGLLSGNKQDIDGLAKICREVGCFYLSLFQTAADDRLGIFEMASDISRGVDEFFGQPLQEKIKWEMDAWGQLQISGFVLLLTLGYVLTDLTLATSQQVNTPVQRRKNATASKISW